MAMATTKIRISDELEQEIKDFVQDRSYRSKREFVDEAVEEKMEREEDALSVEERVDRIEERLDELT